MNENNTSGTPIYLIEPYGIRGADDDFLTLLWVLEARSKDETRQNIQGVLFSAGWAVCTDGYRLHTAFFNCAEVEQRNIPDGVYSIITATKKGITMRPYTEKPYPDYEFLINKEYKYTESVDDGDFSIYLYRMFGLTGKPFNYKYIEPAHSQHLNYLLFNDDSGGTILTDNATKMLFLMPMVAE